MRDNNTCDELPAVLLPSAANAGFSFCIDSTDADTRIPSSSEMVRIVTDSGFSGSIYRVGVGTISALKRPVDRAWAAFWWERTANRSWSSREMP